MIVVQGKSAINSKKSGSFKIVFDNKNIVVSSKDSTTIKLDESVDSISNAVRLDASDSNSDLTVSVYGSVNKATNLIIKSATVHGRQYKLQSVNNDKDGLEKEDYLNELVSFKSAVVDVEAGTSSWISDIEGDMSCSADVSNKKYDCIKCVSIAEEKGKVAFKYKATELLKLFSKCDYVYVDSIDITLNGVDQDTGAISESSFTYINDGGVELTHGVLNLDSSKKDFITFDRGFHMLSGWLDGIDISYQQRAVVSEETKVYKSMFKYLYFSEVSPTHFLRNIEPIAFCAKIVDDSDKGDNPAKYILDKVFTNNAYFNNFSKEPLTVTVKARGTGLKGTPTVTIDNSNILFDTSNVVTSNKRVLLDLKVKNSGKTSTYTFETVSGMNNGTFVSSAVDCKITYSTINNVGNSGRKAEAMYGDLLTFHHMINGFENLLNNESLIRGGTFAALGFITRGLSCALTSNMMEFVMYIYYESLKMIISESERIAMYEGVENVISMHDVNMSNCSQGVPKRIKESMSKQYLEPISRRMFNIKDSFSGAGIFTAVLYCSSFNVSFPRHLPWYPVAPDVGVPLNVNILENIEKKNGILTDDHIAMMKKNLAVNIFETRIDWLLKDFVETSGTLGRIATSWMMMGETVVIKSDGRHQEFYASTDAGYRLGDYNSKNHSATKVSLEGDIGVLWNKWKADVLDNNMAIANHLGYSGPNGKDAEKMVEGNPRNCPVSSLYGRFGVLDIDANKFLFRGNEVSVKILRPNKNVIIAILKEGK